MKFIIPIIAGYLVAAALSDSIYLDLTLTNWTSAWTYVVWAASTIFWVAAGIAIFFVLFALIWDGR